MNENSRIIEMKGIGEKTAELFARVGIRTVGDLIRYDPMSYEIFEDTVPNAE